MELLFTEKLTIIHYGLILALTCAQLLVVYFLSASGSPPRGLGLFTVYFMTTLTAWILFALQYAPANRSPYPGTPTIAVLITSYVLFLATSQRAGNRLGRWLAGAICLAACLSALFSPPQTVFAVQLAGTALLWAAAGGVSAWRGWRGFNVGDGLIAGAALFMIAGLAGVWMQWRGQGDLLRAQSIAFGVHSIAYALVVVGFLASVLLEYQQRLSRLTTEDPLTRLFNRRGLEDALHLNLATASRYHTRTSAIMVDIDQFKRVNDSFGHDLGDRLIQTLAQTLRESCRACDVVARVGGEEFLVVAPNTDATGARTLAERIRGAIGDEPLIVDEQPVAVTASLGIATVEGEADLDELSRAAERALHLAKRDGRNRVASMDAGPLHFSTGHPTVEPL